MGELFQVGMVFPVILNNSDRYKECTDHPGKGGVDT